MLRHLPALLLGAGLATASLWVWDQRRPRPDCDDRCGEGTACEDGACVVAAAAPAPAVEDKPRAKKKRRRRRRSKGGDPGSTSDSATVPRVDDSAVPRFDPTKDQVFEEGTGSERLSDRTINRELAKLDGAFQACVTRAAKASDAPLEPAIVRYQFGVAPSGKVTGVNVTAPKVLRDLQVAACVRVALHRHRFPAFDGVEMSATGSFSL